MSDVWNFLYRWTSAILNIFICSLFLKYFIDNILNIGLVWTNSCAYFKELNAKLF